MRYSTAIAAGITSVFLSACAETPSVAPPQNAMQISKSSMSIAAQRFDQFCILSIGSARDGVMRADAYYGTQAMPNLGNLKLSMGGGSEGIGVQYSMSKNGCMIPSSSGKAPNGKAELKALANA